MFYLCSRLLRALGFRPAFLVRSFLVGTFLFGRRTFLRHVGCSNASEVGSEEVTRDQREGTSGRSESLHAYYVMQLIMPPGNYRTSFSATRHEHFQTQHRRDLAFRATIRQSTANWI